MASFQSKRRWVKVTAAVFVTVLLSLVCTLWLVVDVDRFRAPWVDALNQGMPGRVTLGRLSWSPLGIFKGRFVVHVEGASWSTLQGVEQVNFREIVLDFSMLSVWRRLPEGVLQADGVLARQYSLQVKSHVQTQPDSIMLDALSIQVGAVQWNGRGQVWKGSAASHVRAEASGFARGVVVAGDSGSGLSAQWMRQWNEGLERVVHQMMQKFPVVQGQLQPLGKGSSLHYDQVSADLSFNEGLLQIKNFQATATPGQGLDLKGSAQIGSQDGALKAHLDLVDRYNLTHARDLAIEKHGMRIEHILAEGSAPVRFFFDVGCTLHAPCVDDGPLKESLGRILLANVGRGLVQHQDEIVQRLGQFLHQAPGAPGGADLNALKEVLKKKLQGLF